MAQESLNSKFRLGFLYILLAIWQAQATQWKPKIPSEETVSCKCTVDPRFASFDIEKPNEKIFVNMDGSFKYIQVSMKISSCTGHILYRGNKFITGKVLKANETNTIGIPLTVTYGRNEEAMNGGDHIYHLAIETTNISYTDDVNTSVKCGKFNGFRIKAVGATICVMQTQNSLNAQQEQNSSKIIDRPVISSSRTDKSPEAFMNFIRFMNNEIYFVGTLTAFFLCFVVIVAMMCQRKVPFSQINRNGEACMESSGTAISEEAKSCMGYIHVASDPSEIEVPEHCPERHSLAFPPIPHHNLSPAGASCSFTQPSIHPSHFSHPQTV